MARVKEAVWTEKVHSLSSQQPDNRSVSPSASGMNHSSDIRNNKTTLLG